LAAQKAPPAAPVPASDAWKTIFDGKSLTGWRQWRGTTPKGWEVVDGALTRTGSGGDLVYDKVLKNFELSLEWNIAPGGNSGIMYHASETTDKPYESGPEMQVLDDAKHADGRLRETSAGAAYALYPSPAGVVHPAGEWNKVRLLVKGPHVEHWLNDKKIVTYEIGSPDWIGRVGASKFRTMPKFGTFAEGYLVLQDHGDRVQFRNIKVRELP
jgi:hypothetical protein